MIFQGSQNLVGTGTVTLSNMNSDGGLVVPNAGDTLTILPGVTVQGSSGVVGSSGGGLIANQGTIAAQGGGSLTVQGFTNFTGGTLTGGTWEAVGGSTLRLLGANVVTDAATIVLDGVGSQLDSDSNSTNALAGLTAITASGGLSLQNGAGLSASSVSNAGALTIGTGSSFPVAGYTQTGGSTTLQGGSLGATTLSIQGGTLSGSGTVNGNLTNAAQVSPGSSSPGVLTINGNYTQTAAGALSLKVGGATAGTQFDQLNITGTASLNGTLNVSLIDGFGPSAEESFDVLNFASSTGNFATLNFPLIGGSPAFVTNSTPTSLNLVATTSAPDLAVSAITFTPNAGTIGQNITVNYTVNNLGTVASTTGSWTDSVYLSPVTTLDASALLLDRVTHTGDVAGLSSYSGSLPAPLPGLLAGSYHVIVVTDSALQVPDVNRTNNTGVTSVTLSVQEPLLTNGTALSGTIANGQDLYYRLNVTPGTNVKLDATFAVAAEAEFRLSFGALPTVNSSDQSSTNLSNLQPELVLPSGQGGAYYIWLHGREGAGAGQPFTLQSSLMTFAVSAVTPSSASNQGPVTMDVTGSGFTPQTTVSIQGSSGPAVNAQTVIFISANELYATFDLTTLPIGNYTVQTVDGGNTSTAPASFQVTAQALPSLRWILAINGQGIVFYTNPPHANAPQSYIPPLTFPLTQSGSSGGGGDNVVSGPARPFFAWVQVANLGTNDVDMPSFELIVTHVIGTGIYVQPAKTLAPGKNGILFNRLTPDPLSPGTNCGVRI